MNRSALFVLLASATAAFGAQAHTYSDNARVVGVEPQYENVSVPRQECRSDWVSEARPAGRRDYGGAVVGGLAGALLGNQVGRGHGREAATAVGAVVGALTGDNLANRGRFEQQGHLRNELLEGGARHEIASRLGPEPGVRGERQG